MDGNAVEIDEEELWRRWPCRGAGGDAVPCVRRWRFTSRAPLSLRARLRGPVWPRRHNPPAVIGKGAQSCASRRLEWGEAVP
eukprot:scaffold1663_cov134-Isochrysis_galbana.AAC.1